MNRVTLYRWRIRDPLTGLRRTTRYLASEADIRKEHPDAEMVPGSEEVREVPDGGAIAAGHVQRGPGG